MSFKSKIIVTVITIVLVAISGVSGMLYYKHQEEAKQKERLALFTKELEKSADEFSESVDTIADEAVANAENDTDPEKDTTKNTEVFQELFVTNPENVVYINPGEYASNEMTGEEVEVMKVTAYQPTANEKAIKETEKVIAIDLSLSMMDGNPGQQINASDFSVYSMGEWYPMYNKNNDFTLTFDEKKSTTETIYFTVPKELETMELTFISYSDGMGVHNDSFTIPYNFILDQIP